MATVTTRRVRPAKSARSKSSVRMLSRAHVLTAVRTMAQPKGTARFAAGKALAVTAEKDPQRVYPCFDDVAALLTSESKIVRWNAMQILARLAPVDESRKLDGVLDTYLGFIRGGNLISAANAIGGAARMTLARPELLARTLPAILSVEGETYETPECRHVAIGRALEALEQLWAQVRSRPEVVAFVRRQLSSPRPPVARLARRLAAAEDGNVIQARKTK